MNDYLSQNKAAWEEAFDRRINSFGEDHATRLQTERQPFLAPEVWDALSPLPLQGAHIAQFCCNNGRELMSLVRHTGARAGVGFDLAGNILAQARRIAGETGIPCTFVEGDVCQAPDSYHGQFDLILITIGALCWMKDLAPFFAKVYACLKPGGRMLLHDAHPVTAMFAVPQEEAFDPENPARLVYDYFRSDPFVDTYGMVYLAGQAYDSKPFTSFSHTLGSVVTHAVQNGLTIERLTEFSKDISDDTAVLDGLGIPLSYLFLARRPRT